MQFKEIKAEMTYPGFGEGYRPGVEVKVAIQFGKYNFEAAEITLTPEETKQVVALAVRLAMDHLTLDPETIDVVGDPGQPEPTPVEQSPETGAASASQEIEL